jgi:hypothetical protein
MKLCIQTPDINSKEPHRRLREIMLKWASEKLVGDDMSSDDIGLG